MSSETRRPNAANRVQVALPNSGPPSPSPLVSIDTALSGAMGARIRITTSPPASATYEGLLYTADPVTNLMVISLPAAPPQEAVKQNISATTNSSPAANPILTKSNTFKILPISQLTSFTLLSLPSSSYSSSSSSNSAHQQPAVPEISSRQNIPPHQQQQQQQRRSNQQSANRNKGQGLDLPEPCSLPGPALNARLNNTISALKKQDIRRGGRNITREAQDIFDGIARTYPTRWMGTTMVVNENIVIESPYGVDDCKILHPSNKDGRDGRDGKGVARAGSGAGTGTTAQSREAQIANESLARIKRTLGMEREKLALRRGLGTAGLGFGSAGRGGKRGAGAVAGLGAGERKGG